ncbi:putative monocarboxylate transporter [Aureobasidium sp. EXF-8845]|nr:putative monocarboxylate transporter [Aureobasidium sp. EXF-8845]KAI4854363.1 putative monocarboxylate transporter [Aureobasidium sp. EXF-8846]
MTNNDNKPGSLDTKSIQGNTQGSGSSVQQEPASEKALPYNQIQSGETTPSALDHDLHDYPEGGLEAWLVVLGAWAIMFSGMGLLNVLSSLHAFLSTHQLSSYSPSSVGWIFSTFPFFLYFAGVQIGPLFDVYGPRVLVITGSVGLVTSLMCLSVSTEYYQFILSFGVLGGLSTCCLFTSAVSAIGHWFHRRRGFAMGIACTAGGSGGLAYSLIILFLAPRIGFGWSIRIIGFISAGLCLVGCLLVKSRLPPNKVKGAKIDIKALRDPPYAAVTIAITLVEFAVFIPYTFLVDQALGAGMSRNLSYALVPILNASAIPGRLLPGYIADKYGRLNTMTITTIICCLLTFLLWLIGSGNHAAIIAYTVLFGFWSGAAISLTPVCIQQVCKTEDIGKRTGTTFTISSFGTLIGIPIAGAILGDGRGRGGGYDGLIAFSGGVIAFVVARGLTGGWKWKTVI